MTVPPDQAPEPAETPGGIWLGTFLGIVLFVAGLLSLTVPPLPMLPACGIIAALFTVSTTNNPRHRRIAAGLLITVAVCLLVFGTCVAIFLSNFE